MEIGMNAIVTVIGKDHVGIIADVTALLAQYGVNVLDISQTVLQEYFTMIMLVRSTEGAPAFDEIQRRLAAKGEEMQLAIRIQREDIFSAMHTI